MNRREMLRLFGIGATVVPIVGSEPVMAAEAKLVEAPKVELIHKSPSLVIPGPGRVGVTFTQMDPTRKRVYVFEAESVITHMTKGLQTVRSRFPHHEELLQTEGWIEWEIRGHTGMTDPHTREAIAFMTTYDF
jgi:hypothetical protein